MKTYVLIVSEYFPKNHKRAGDNTFFVDKIKYAVGYSDDIEIMEEFGELIGKKLHTIRANYELWEKRINEINKGNALLSIRVWTGKPYNSKQHQVLCLSKADGVGIEKINEPINFVYAGINGEMVGWGDIAKNDGLRFEDFEDWFKNPKHDPMAIIHFTDFRYSNCV